MVGDEVELTRVIPNWYGNFTRRTSQEMRHEASRSAASPVWLNDLFHIREAGAATAGITARWGWDVCPPEGE